ncbi:glutamine amidotransferase [Methylobacillus arboreus]|uniref:glutamine amidotransferase n=1 Tax=Methylobacillus arboreus TaxID=755170 RepID=UPI001E62E70B|nr:glutamine amidotransferase [Methylobacillus arboreus]MCB5189938.1 glutamine amidotransferase [Methylobacillus arboreus]
MKTAVTLRHIAFEDLDGIAPLLEQASYQTQYIDTPNATGTDLKQARDADLLVVLGGPIGVYQTDDYPFLQPVIDLTGERLRRGQPTLGICLGAQIMAHSLGAKVYAGEAGKEIGWSPLSLTAEGRQSVLAPIGEDHSVLHWHGDTFDLPEGAVRLASSSLYANQAFAYGKHGLALQFHIEVTAAGLERWYVGHVGELGGFSIPELRKQGQAFAPQLAPRLERVIKQWLSQW